MAETIIEKIYQKRLKMLFEGYRVDYPQILELNTSTFKALQIECGWKPKEDEMEQEPPPFEDGSQIFGMYIKINESHDNGQIVLKEGGDA